MEAAKHDAELKANANDQLRRETTVKEEPPMFTGTENDYDDDDQWQDVETPEELQEEEEEEQEETAAPAVDMTILDLLMPNEISQFLENAFPNDPVTQRRVVSDVGSTEQLIGNLLVTSAECCHQILQRSGRGVRVFDEMKEEIFSSGPAHSLLRFAQIIQLRLEEQQLPLIDLQRLTRLNEAEKQLRVLVRIFEMNNDVTPFSKTLRSQLDNTSRLIECFNTYYSDQLQLRNSAAELQREDDLKNPDGVYEEQRVSPPPPPPSTTAESADAEDETKVSAQHLEEQECEGKSLLEEFADNFVESCLTSDVSQDEVADRADEGSPREQGTGSREDDKNRALVNFFKNNFDDVAVAAAATAADEADVKPKQQANSGRADDKQPGKSSNRSFDDVEMISKGRSPTSVVAEFTEDEALLNTDADNVVYEGSNGCIIAIYEDDVHGDGGGSGDDGEDLGYMEESYEDDNFAHDHHEQHDDDDDDDDDSHLEGYDEIDIKNEAPGNAPYPPIEFADCVTTPPSGQKQSISESAFNGSRVDDEERQTRTKAVAEEDEEEQTPTDYEPVPSVEATGADSPNQHQRNPGTLVQAGCGRRIADVLFSIFSCDCFE